MILIGIDTGVHTGIAAWDTESRSFIFIDTLKIHQAIKLVELLNDEEDIKVFVEDARKRKWFGKAGREKLQGAGSIKRDSKIWEDFLDDIKAKYELIPPRANKTKLTAEHFGQITKYEKRTSEHSRDAAMLVFRRF